MCVCYGFVVDVIVAVGVDGDGGVNGGVDV